MWRREESRLRNKLKWRQAAASAKLSSFRLAASHPLDVSREKGARDVPAPANTGSNSGTAGIVGAMHAFGPLSRMRSSRIVVEQPSAKSTALPSLPPPSR